MSPSVPTPPPGGFRITIGQIAGNAFMRDGGDLAILACANFDVLQRCRTVGGIIGHQRTGERHLDWPTDLFGTERGQHHV